MARGRGFAAAALVLALDPGWLLHGTLAVENGLSSLLLLAVVLGALHLGTDELLEAIGLRVFAGGSRTQNGLVLSGLLVFAPALLLLAVAGWFAVARWLGVVWPRAGAPDTITACRACGPPGWSSCP